MKKIAFLFMIYDSIHLEELWDIFFKGVDPSLYRIYIHYKHNKPLRYFESYKLTHCVDTIYAHISQISCKLHLLREGLLDDENEHFIFVSQSCIPMKSFHPIYSFLDSSKSYFNIMPQTQCFPRCDPLLAYFPKEHIQKAYTWNIYNRKHAKVMLEEENTIEFYRNVYGPDEIYFITSIYRRGLENEIVTTLNSPENATTFTNWDDMKTYPYVSTHSLKNYDDISTDELRYLLRSKCLFGRKFNPECAASLSTDEYIQTISTTNTLLKSIAHHEQTDMLVTFCDDNLTDKNTWHSYIEVYEQLFSSKKDTAKNVLEIGIGPSMPNGGSILMWAGYFQNAKIHAADIIPLSSVNPLLIPHPRIYLHTQSDAYDPSFFTNTFLSKEERFDILVDDGPHTIESMVKFIKFYSQVLKEDGIMVVEDVQNIEWIDILRAVTPDHLKPYVEVYDRRQVKGRYDDIMFVINRSRPPQQQQQQQQSTSA